MATTLRSTQVITSFVELTDELAAIKLRAKQIEREIEDMTTDVLDQIGERREVRVNKQVRILTPRIDEKVSQIVDVTEYCKIHGLPFSVRTPEYVASATFLKLVRENRIPESFIGRTQTVVVSVQ